MSRCFIIVMAVLLLGIFVVSCERTKQVEVSNPVAGISELTQFPAEYGSLEAVTSDAKYPNWAQLWFQDTAGTIRIVRINWLEKKVLDDVIIVPRTSPLKLDDEEV